VRLIEVPGGEQHVWFSIDATLAGTAVDESAEAVILAASAPNEVAQLDAGRGEGRRAGHLRRRPARPGCTCFPQGRNGHGAHARSERQRLGTCVEDDSGHGRGDLVAHRVVIWSRKTSCDARGWCGNLHHVRAGAAG
jgi:hypothetical protein